MLSAEETKRFREEFLKIDLHNDGVLTLDEIEFALKVQGFEPEEAELRELLKHVDMNKDREISFSEFVSCQLGEEHLTSNDYLSYVFGFFNIDGTEGISLEELQDQLAKMGVEKPKRLGREIMLETDLDQDGVISYKEFVSIMSEPADSTSESEYDSEETQ